MTEKQRLAKIRKFRNEIIIQLVKENINTVTARLKEKMKDAGLEKL